MRGALARGSVGLNFIVADELRDVAGTGALICHWIQGEIRHASQ
jgi:hypothetical protein